LFAALPKRRCQDLFIGEQHISYHIKKSELLNRTNTYKIRQARYGSPLFDKTAARQAAFGVHARRWKFASRAGECAAKTR
jgi:hypothetical protein